MRKVKIVRLRDVKTDLLLFRDIKTDYIESIALAGYSYQKIYVDIFKSFSGRIVLSFPSITKSIYYFLFKYNKKESWKINIILAYYYGVINSIAPKVLITYHPQVSFFGSLITLTKNTHILALFLTDLRPRGLINMQPSIARDPSLAHYYVWGEQAKKDLASIGQLEKNIHVVGSMMAGIHHLSDKVKNNSKTYDICLISNIKEVEDKDGEENEDILVEYTADYLSSKPYVKVCVASRQTVTRGKIRERDFYSSRLKGFDLEFIESDVDNLSSYKAISSSEIVIAQNSGLAFEALGWGHKVLFCQPNKLDFWTPVEHDLHYAVIDYNQTRFNNLLDELFDIPLNQYREKTKDNAAKNCYFDKTNPPHIIIQNKLNELLKTSKENN